jgi:hypothetical protein
MFAKGVMMLDYSSINIIKQNNGTNGGKYIQTPLVI